jgi:hypothetical protein
MLPASALCGIVCCVALRSSFLFQLSGNAACAEVVSVSLQRSLFNQANQNVLIKEQSVEECDARKAS